jgi:amino acid adenylation domain-containing protein
MLGHYENLLACICENKDQVLGKMPLMSPEERSRVVEDFNQPRLFFPVKQCLHEIFEQYVAVKPDAVATTFDGVNLTYGELDRKSNQVAHYLIEKGVGPEMIVGICLERSLELIIGLLGILKAGGAYLPLDLSYPAERVAFMLEDSNATVLLTQQSLVQNLPQTEASLLALDELAKNVLDNYSADKPERRANATDLAYVIYTSGSTGKPKGVQVTHYNVVRLLQATEHWFGFSETDVWTLFHSFAFDFSVWEIWGALGYGGRLVIVPQLVSRTPLEFYQLLSSENVTILNQTPSAFRQLIQLEESGQQELPLSLRYIIFGGEALGLSNLKPWFDRHGDITPQLINMYGITETTVHVSYRPLTAQDLTSGSMIGKPIPDLQIYILDENREPTPIGVPGEMYVGGAGLARGYLNRDLLTRERFIADPFNNEPGARLYRTGDLARFLNDGDIEYLGRIDQQIQLRGFRVELGEIESVISSHAAVKQCVVEVREDRPGDQRLIAYVVLVPGAELKITEMRQQASTQLPDYMVPQHLVELDKLPLTPNGKLDRKALPAPTMQHSDDETFKAAETDLEIYLTKIWSKIFLKENIGVYDNFFEIGGHSLLAIQIVNTLSTDLETEIPLQFIFEHPCILDLAQAIEQQLVEELEKLSASE